MPLSWNEIRARAIQFSKSWTDAARERSEAQTFWNEFFEVFGIRRRVVASFEEPVKNLTGDTDFIDLIWPGKLIAEHKSRGKDLGKAHTQAIGYVHSLVNDSRADQAPQYILVSDFARFALHDLEEKDASRQTIEFPLSELHKHVRDFAFIAGYETRRLDPEDPINVKAVERLGELHDRLEEGGYTGHDLQRFMVRILFCLFADDTGIFEPDTFKLFLQKKTHADGSDLGSQLARFFSVLNQKEEQRQANLDEALAALPYVNGDLFAESLAFAEFNSAMRNALLTCCEFHWDKISPAVFGSLFQSIMEDKERRQIGAHYTSERDILKLIRSLFLDDLRAEFAAAGKDKKKLAALGRKLGELRFLDPACGCGNFLVIAYRELRRLELDILQARFGENITEGDIRAECRLNVSQMYGIEIEEWPARIAEVALWLMDHQMNAELFQRFGQVRATTPLTKSPNIRIANALRIDWNEVLPAKDCSFVMGNPPFIGKKARVKDQIEDIETIFSGVQGAGTLDYVCCWYLVAAQYTRESHSPCALVSTNSISQGEQPGILWPVLFSRFGVKIHFAHRTFAWESEAKGKAHVHVVIIGFGVGDRGEKYIWDYERDPANPTHEISRNISPYLIEGPDFALVNRQLPLSNVPEMVFGNMPNDDGNLLLTDEERERVIREDGRLATFIKPIVSAKEYLHGERRWCLWLADAPPQAIRDIPEIRRRVEAVRDYRNASKRSATKELAKTPSLFGEIRQPTSRYVLFPRHSSENRTYIPISYFDPTHIVHDSCLCVPNANLYDFGVLASLIHMAWVRQVCGRLESRYRYSNKLVYNNYPWPSEPTAKQRARVESAAQAVLDARAAFPGSTLADLYDPLAMPAKLTQAHAELDEAVDRCYRAQPFTSERQRVEFLFGLYEKYTAPLAGQALKPAKKPRRGSK